MFSFVLSLSNDMLYIMFISMMCSVCVYVVCIQQACGYEFTNKLHRMFTDVNLSNDLNGKFAEYVKSHGTDLGLTFSIMVLQVTAAALLLCVCGLRPVESRDG